MLYHSTSGTSHAVGLREAVLAGHAPDGGLYMPDKLPLLPAAFFNNMPDMTLPETAYVAANTLFSDDVDSQVLSRVASEVFSFDVPMRRLSDSVSVLELFHGPTGSFNDIGARFLAGLLPHLKLDAANPVNFLMATAGDSGAAVAHALHNLPGAKVTVLFPAKRLSEVQQAQLASLGGNVSAVEVNGSIDVCRALVERVFSDPAVTERVRLTPASSINIARFLPQIFYYFHAYAALRRAGDRRKVVIAVPGGNLGNLAAGLVAKRMGLPVSRFIVSNNLNASFVNYLSTGRMEVGGLVTTGAGALDVSRPTNFPRITWLYDDDVARLRADLSGAAFSDDAIERAVRMCGAAGYGVDSSSATAWQALVDSVDPATETGIFFAIASPEKTAAAPSAAADYLELLSRPRSVMRIGRSYQALVNHLLNR